MGTKSLFTDQGVACIKWKKKGGANLSLPVNPELQIALHGCFEESGHEEDRVSALFLPVKSGNNKGGSLQSRASKNIFCKYFDAAGLGAEYTPHSMRATFATAAIKNSARIEDLQKALGHAYISTKQSYIHKIEDLIDCPTTCLKF